MIFQHFRKEFNGFTTMLLSGSGQHNGDSRRLLFITVSVLRLGGDSPSAENRFHRLSVLAAHAAVDEDVERGVDVGGDLKKPGRRKKRVLVATSCVHLWDEEKHQPARTKLRRI